MNEWIIFWINICHFWWRVPFLSILNTFGALFLFKQYQFSLNWRYFELNLGYRNIESNIEWTIFWQNSNIELMQWNEIHIECLKFVNVLQRATPPATALILTNVSSLTWTPKTSSLGWRLKNPKTDLEFQFFTFQEDFNRHYLTNKAPYTLAMHTNWFQEENQVEKHSAKFL